MLLGTTRRYFVASGPGQRFLAVTRTPAKCASRCFSISTPRRALTTELSDEEVSELRVNQDRLMKNLHYSCQWGTGVKWGPGPTETGMARLALSNEDKSVRDWFCTEMKRLRCNVSVDEMGNIFAVRPGRRTDVPATFIGSHLDTQPTGGRYDGILGVLAGMEALQVMDDLGLESEGGIGVVNWTNEEGARFPMTIIASGVWGGSFSLDRAYSLEEVRTVASPHVVDSNRETLKGALMKTGYLGDIPCSYRSIPMAAHFELHIEQGPHLVSSKQHIGVVTAAQAYRWYHIRVTGSDAHSGTTAFEHRADAMYASAQMIVRAREVAAIHGCLATVGIVQASPGSVNTVPGLVTFSLDVRGSTTDLVQRVETYLREEFNLIAGNDRSRKPCSVEWRVDFDSPAVEFHKDCIDCVRESAEAVVPDPKSQIRHMVSGAGHDSVSTSKQVPTSMIFVPCRDGLSHHPQEFCTPEDCATGASVILQAAVRYDRKRFMESV